MKNNLVFWGSNENNQKILTILRLRADEGLIDIWTFFKENLEKEFVEKMFADWDEIDPSTFPEPATYVERKAAETDLLPENIKADDTQLVIRAEQEWRVRILSILLYEMMSTEIEALKDQIKSIDSYDKTLWDTAKSYNDKVILHNQERNISREQFGILRRMLNEAFDYLKSLMQTENKKYEEEANANQLEIYKRLDAIEKDANEGKRLNNLFEELKKLQEETKDVRLTRDGRRDLWKRFNTAFDLVKKQRNNNAGVRFEKRVQGLKGAIARMEDSIRKDKDSIDFQNRRAKHVSAGKLEMQLREAKASMIKTRIESKEHKLNDMYLTLEKLEKQLAKINTEKPAKKENPPKAQKEAKSETPKAEEAKPETPKVEEAKPEIPKVEEAKPETPKAEEAKPETPKAEEAKPETPKVEEVKPETPKVEEAKPEAPKAEEAKPETPKVEEAKPETPKAEEAKPETPKAEEAKPETPKVEEAKPETPKVEDVKLETPEVTEVTETPKSQSNELNAQVPEVKPEETVSEIKTENTDEQENTETKEESSTSVVDSIKSAIVSAPIISNISNVVSEQSEDSPVKEEE